MKPGLLIILLIALGVSGYATFYLYSLLAQSKPYVTKVPSREKKLTASEKEVAATHKDIPKEKSEGKTESKAEAKSEGEDKSEGEAAKNNSVYSAANSVHLDEIVVNPPSKDTKRVHLLDMQLELLIFDTNDRPFIENHLSVINNKIIETSQIETYEDLTSMGGKLYLKEQMVSRLNKLFAKPMIEDIHFNTFFLQ